MYLILFFITLSWLFLYKFSKFCGIEILSCIKQYRGRRRMEAESGSGYEKDTMKVLTDTTKDDTLNGIKKPMKDVAMKVTTVTRDVATNTNEPNKIKPVARVEPLLRSEEFKTSSVETDISPRIVAGPDMPAPIYVATLLSTDPASLSTSDMPHYLQLFHPDRSNIIYSSDAPERNIHVISYICILIITTLHRFNRRRFWEPSNAANRRILQQSFRSILWLLRNLTTAYSRFFGSSHTEMEGFRKLRSIYIKTRRIRRMFGRLKVAWYQRTGHENSDAENDGDEDDSGAEYAPARYNKHVNIVRAIKRYMEMVLRMRSSEETIPFKLDATNPLIEIVIDEFASFREQALGAYSGSNRPSDNSADPLFFLDLLDFSQI
ncbi:uncharacterized protein [Drosophila bipectinata]|uniref:uncharacterized protein isoform X1 n=1 Tax=Drosophila bipectinata TaxID=42026 RepID=UPI0038B33874